MWATRHTAVETDLSLSRCPSHVEVLTGCRSLGVYVDGQSIDMATKFVRAVPVAIAALLLSAGVTGCTNVGSSNGQNARGGNPNNTPAGQLTPNHSATSTPESPNN